MPKTTTSACPWSAVESYLLRHYVTEALALLDLAKQRIHGLEHDEVGSFVLGCPNALGAYFLPPFFAEFLPTAPHVTLSLWGGYIPPFPTFLMLSIWLMVPICTARAWPYVSKTPSWNRGAA